MNEQQALGRAGEAAAAQYLEGQGYSIRERNFRCRAGEIDLIATTGDFLVFIEVKTRKAGSLVHPSLSVTPRKQAKVRQLGEIYCAANPRLVLQPRFDVVSVEVSGGKTGGRKISGEKFSGEKFTVEHIENAF